MRGGRYPSAQFLSQIQQYPPGITATGRPGEIHIEGVGLRKVADMRQDRIWDRVAIPATNLAGVELTWFRDIAGKTRLETSMTQQSKLPEGQEAIVFSVSFILNPTTPPNDVTELLRRGYGEFVLDDDNRIMSGPIIFFPQKYGPYGQIMTTNTAVDDGLVTNGVPSPGANPRLMMPIYITENRTFRWTLRLYEGCTLPSVVATNAWVAMDVLISRPMR